MNTKTLTHALLLLGFISLTLAGTCINIVDPICLPNNDCVVDSPIATKDTTEMIIQLLDGLGDFDFLGDPDTLYQCIDDHDQNWQNPGPGSPPDCGVAFSDTVVIGRAALLRDLNDFMYDGQLSSIIDILPVDTCKCDEAIFLMRAVVGPNVDINDGVARGTSPTRGNGTGSIIAAGFNYAISLQPVNDGALANQMPESFPGSCYSKDDVSNTVQYEMVKNDSCRQVLLNPTPSIEGPSVKVAIVDTGADPTFAYNGSAMASLNNSFSTSTEMDIGSNNMLGYVAYGDQWPGNGNDDNGNCFTDDYFGYDFFHDDNSPADKKGHGTHMTYTVLTADAVAGHKVRVLPLQFGGFDENGEFGCDLFAGICAISYARTEESDIINLSWGFYSDIFHDVLYEQIRQASANDILVVTSAGNDTRWIDPDNCAHWPSGFSAVPQISHSVISVAALDVFVPGGPFKLAAYSNYGLKIDLAAPGTQIQGAKAGSGYQMMPLDGTSMAAAVVSRRAAMLRIGGAGVDVPAGVLKTMILAETVPMKNACIEGRRALDITKDNSLMQAIGY